MPIVYSLHVVGGRLDELEFFRGEGGLLLSARIDPSPVVSAALVGQPLKALTDRAVARATVRIAHRPEQRVPPGGFGKRPNRTEIPTLGA